MSWLSWELIDIIKDSMNPYALGEWKDIFFALNDWMQAVIFGLFVMLCMVMFLECLWGFLMNRTAKLASGFALGFYISFILMVMHYGHDPEDVFMYAVMVGAIAAFLNGYFERAFLSLFGFMYGTALGSWIVYDILKMNTLSYVGRVVHLVIAVSVGIIFLLTEGKLMFITTAIIGGTVLGLIAVTLIPSEIVENIPYLSEVPIFTYKLYENLLPVFLIAMGILIQFLQWHGINKKRKAPEIPTGEDWGARAWNNSGTAENILFGNESSEDRISEGKNLDDNSSGEKNSEDESYKGQSSEEHSFKRGNSEGESSESVNPDDKSFDRITDGGSGFDTINADGRELYAAKARENRLEKDCSKKGSHLQE